MQQLKMFEKNKTSKQTEHSSWDFGKDHATMAIRQGPTESL